MLLHPLVAVLIITLDSLGDGVIQLIPSVVAKRNHQDEVTDPETALRLKSLLKQLAKL